jgi:plasmid stability protein
MAQLLVRNIEENVKDRLRRRAKRHGRSMEEEAREILRQAVLSEPRREREAGAQIAAMFKDLNVDFEIPEFKDEQVRTPKFPE